MTAPYWNVDSTRIDRNWRAIEIELDAPRPGRIERTLRLFGFSANLTRLVVATPALRRAWFVAIGLATVVCLSILDNAAARADLFALLLIAPLVPVLGVSFAYGIEADPAHEISVATPLRGLRLILTRAVVVLLVSIALLGLAILATPSASAMAFAWLLPALGLTTATVALMTFVTPRQGALIVTVIWVVGVVFASAATGDPVAAFTVAGQVAMISIAMSALAVTWFRRDQFDRLEARL